MQNPADQTALTARLFSIEMLILYAGMIFSFGVGYSALAGGTDANKTAIKEMRVNQDEVIKDISLIKGSVGVIEANQKSMDQNINRRMTRQDHRIDKIIDLLERRHTNRTHP